MEKLRVGHQEDGFVYIGGDPSSQKSWVPKSVADEFKQEPPSFAASAGRGMMDVAQGVKQFALELADSEKAKQYTKQVEDEISSYERGVDGLDVGRFLGNIAATAPAALIAGGGPAMSILRAGTAGGLAGGAQFVPEGESRAANAAVGGILGAGMQSIPAGYGALKNAAKTNATVAAAANAAGRLGVRPTPAQASGSRTLQRLEAGLENTAGGGLAIEQLQRSNQTAINRAIADKLGIKSDSLDREVLGQAKTKASRWYDFALKGESLEPDARFAEELDDIVHRFNPPGAELSADVARRISSLKNAKFISAEEYQAARSAIGRDAVAAYRSGDTNRALALDAMQEIYDDLAARNLPAHKLEYFNRAREQTRILKTLEKAADPQSGNVSTQKLLTAVRQKDPNFFYYGKGDNPLSDAMMAGSFLKQAPDSFTAARLGGMTAPGALGGILGYQQGGSEGALKGAALGTAAPYALARTYLGLTAPSGILGRAAARGANYLPPALGGAFAQP